MTKKFHSQLEDLCGRVLEMGALARRNVDDGVRALVQQDAELAAAIVAGEERLNRLDVEIERDALDLLALNQPMAQDLRTLGAILKVITYLDRIGRYGYDIAKVAQELRGKEQPTKPVGFQVMAERACAMLDEALEAFRTRDAARARAVPPQDEVVDALNEQAFRQCITYMMEDPRTIGVCAHHILVARHLERVADNAGKIAEKTLYMVTGERRLQV